MHFDWVQRGVRASGSASRVVGKSEKRPKLPDLLLGLCSAPAPIRRRASPSPKRERGLVSDGTAAVISAAVKAVVRNSFVKLSYERLSPGSEPTYAAVVAASALRVAGSFGKCPDTASMQRLRASLSDDT